MQDLFLLQVWNMNRDWTWFKSFPILNHTEDWSFFHPPNFVPEYQLIQVLCFCTLSAAFCCQFSHFQGFICAWHPFLMHRFQMPVYQLRSLPKKWIASFPSPKFCTFSEKAFPAWRKKLRQILLCLHLVQILYTMLFNQWLQANFPQKYPLQWQLELERFYSSMDAYSGKIPSLI